MATTKVSIIEVALRKDRKSGNPFANLTAAKLKTFVGIKEARALLGVAHNLYVRQLLGMGRLEGVKVQYKGYSKWLLDPASLTYYTEHKARRTGLRRFVLRAKAADEARIRDALTSLGIEFTLEFSYKGKADAADEAEDA